MVYQTEQGRGRAVRGVGVSRSRGGGTGASPELVTMYLPYQKVVYGLEEKSDGAKRMERRRALNSPVWWAGRLC